MRVWVAEEQFDAEEVFEDVYQYFDQTWEKVAPWVFELCASD